MVKQTMNRLLLTMSALTLYVLFPGCLYVEDVGSPSREARGLGITYECMVECQKDTTTPKQVWVEEVCGSIGQASELANQIVERIEPDCSGHYVYCTATAIGFCTIGDDDE